MAVAPAFTKENVNYIRLQLLVSKYGTKGLRDFFDDCRQFRPAVLQRTLQGNRPSLQRLQNNGTISAYQWDILFPPGGSITLSSQFDVTLLVLLLRNLGGLRVPRGFKWNELPAATDTVVYHDIARLKYYRNKYAHATPSVSDADFLNDWKDLEPAILRIVPAAGHAQYTANIKDLLTQPLSQHDLVKILDHINQDLQTSRNEASGNTTEIKDKIETLTALVKSIFDTLKDPEVSESLDILGEDLKKAYKQKFQKVQSLSSVGVPSMFEVISKLFVDLDRTPLEIKCSNFGKQQTIRNPRTATSSKGKLTPGIKVKTSTRTKLKTKAEKQVKVDTTADITNLLTDDFNPNMLPILIEADAGVGKTTLLHRLTYYWVNGLKDMDKFKLVFLIPLRNVRSNRLEDIICDDLKLVKEEHKQVLKRCLKKKGDEILFLLDGLDEVELWPDCELNELLKGEETHVCCSSRPRMGEHNFNAPTFLSVNLLGFSDETLVTYINLYFEGDNGNQHQDMADQLLLECRKHFFCKALIRIPLYAGIFCYLLDREMGKLPDTATQLLNQCIMEVLTTYLKRNQLPQEKPAKVTFEKSPLELSVPTSIRRFLGCIAKLAYMTLMSQKISFSLDIVKTFDLSLEDITDIGLFNIEDDGAAICFRHKLFHEYFAGLYLTKHEKKISDFFATETKHAILSRSHIFQNAFFFAAGISEEAFKLTVHCLNSICESDGDKIDIRDTRNESKKCDDVRQTLKIQTLGEKLTSRGYNPLILAFYLELLYERNYTADRLYIGISDINIIPVHCASVHSLAAALHVLEMQKEDSTVTTPKLLMLIDGPVLDPNQLAAILDECNSRPEFTHIRLLGANLKLISAVMELKWKYLRRIDFEKSDYVIPFNDLVCSSPCIKTIVYDHQTWKHGKIFLKDNESNAADHDFHRNSCIILQPTNNRDAMPNGLMKFPFACLCIRIDEHYTQWSVGREKCLPKSVTSVIIETQITYMQYPQSLLHRYEVYLNSPENKMPPINVFLFHGEKLSISDRSCLIKGSTNCVLEYYRQNTEVKTLQPTSGGQTCMDAILSVEWPYIERIEFRKCEILLPVSVLIDRCPKLTYVVYDQDTQNKGRAFEKECIKNHNKEIIVQLTASSFRPGLEMCKLCTINHPNSRQLMVNSPIPGKKITNYLFGDSIKAVCINYDYFAKLGSRIDLLLTTFKIVHMVYMHFVTDVANRSEHQRYKKIMKKTLKVLKKDRVKWLASIEACFLCEVLRMTNGNYSPDTINMSYDEMKEICKNKKQSHEIKKILCGLVTKKLIEEGAEKSGKSVEWYSQYFFLPYNKRESDLVQSISTIVMSLTFKRA